MGKIIYHLKPISTYRLMPRKPRRCLSTSTVLSDGWESSGWALSPLRLQTELLNIRKHLNGSTGFTSQLSNPRAWNLLPSLNVNCLDAFTSILQQVSPMTSELVSISQRAQVPTPLNVMAIGRSFDGSRRFTVGVQIGGCVNSGLCCGLIKSHGTASADVRLCPYSQTLRLSQGMLGLTSRVLRNLGWLLTRECALFAIHCLKDLPVAAGAGRTETPLSGVEDVKSCQ